MSLALFRQLADCLNCCWPWRTGFETLLSSPGWHAQWLDDGRGLPRLVRTYPKDTAARIGVKGE